MPQYTMILTSPEGRQHRFEADFAEDSVAIETARDAAGAEHPIVAVTRGQGEAATLLGSWEFEQGEAKWWSEE